jgi:hypothetical protein
MVKAVTLRTYILEGDDCAVFSWLWWEDVSERFTVFGCQIFVLLVCLDEGVAIVMVKGILMFVGSWKSSSTMGR